MSKCFIMMPFGGDFDAYYRTVLHPAVVASGSEPIRADEIYSSRAVMEDVCRAIVASSICLADVSGRNPNVAYELGMAHAVGKPVILLTQEVEDVPFDYQHLRILSYDPGLDGWEQDLRNRVTETISEILLSPEEHLVFSREDVDPRAKQTALARDHLRRIYLASAFDHYRTNWMYCNERGDTLIKTSWNVQARSQLFLMCHHLVTDRAGNIDVRRVHDKQAARDLDWVESDSGPRMLCYFPLLGTPKEPGDEFTMSTEVFAEYYFDFEALFASGEGMMSSQATEGGIRYLGRRDYIHLPKTERFAGIAAEYESHPDESQIGQRVLALDKGDHYLLQLEYDWPEPHQSATVARLVAQ